MKLFTGLLILAIYLFTASFTSAGVHTGRVINKTELKNTELMVKVTRMCEYFFREKISHFKAPVDANGTYKIDTGKVPRCDSFREDISFTSLSGDWETAGDFLSSNGPRIDVIGKVKGGVYKMDQYVPAEGHIVTLRAYQVHKFKPAGEGYNDVSFVVQSKSFKATGNTFIVPDFFVKIPVKSADEEINLELYMDVATDVFPPQSVKKSRKFMKPVDLGNITLEYDL